MSGWSGPARACACCDSTSRVEPIGWSPSGLSLLLRHETHQACERKIMLEVHNVGSGSAAACHDLLANPEKRIECSTVSSDYEKAPGRSSQESIYSGKLRSIDPSSLELTHPMPDQGDPLTPIPYQVRLARSATVLAKLELHLLNGEYASGPTLPEVVVLPVPRQERAAVFVRGIDTAPGTGHQGWLLRWIPLKGTENLPLVDGVQWTSGAGAGSGHGNKVASTRENNAGFKLHQQGKYAEAARHFLAAVDADPEGAWLSRYNLACAYARMNQPDKAMATLQVLFAKAPAEQAEKRRKRAKVDEDLVSLRSRPDFQALVCGGACASAALASAPHGGAAATTVAPVASVVPVAVAPTPAQPEEPKQSGLLSCGASPAPGAARWGAVCWLALGYLGWSRRRGGEQRRGAFSIAASGHSGRLRQARRLVIPPSGT